MVDWVYLVAGLVGGATYHLYWMVMIGRTSVQDETDIPKESERLRISLLGLSCITGLVAGFMVGIWFLDDLDSSNITKNKVMVLSFIAGLSGDGLLGLLKRSTNINS